MISPEQIPGTPPKVNKNLLIVYLGIGVSILSIIAVVIIAVTQLAPKTYQTNGNKTTPSITATTVPTSTPIIVNNKANIFLKIGVATNAAGNIYQIAPISLEQESVINSNNIIHLLSWSKDNRYLALSLIQSNEEILAFWDNEAKQIIETNLAYTSKSNYIWNDEGNFIYLTYPNTTLNTTSIDLPEVTLKTSKIDIKQEIAQAYISPNLDKMIYAIAADNSIVYLNLETGKKVSLNTLPLNLKDFQGAFWIDTDNFVFFAKNGIFNFDTKLTQAQSLATLTSSEIDPLNSKKIILSANKANIYFVHESRLFKYSINTKITTELFDLTKELPFSSEVELHVLPNEKYITLTYKENTKLFNATKRTLQDLCDKYCNEVVVEN